MNEESSASERVDRRRRAPDKSAIRQVAADLFDKRGYHEVSMDDLAAALGITKPTLYAHVSTKSALAADIIDDVIGTAERALDRAMLSPGPAETLRVLILNWTKLNATFGSSLRLLEHGPRALPAEQIERYEMWSGEAFRRIRSVIVEGQRSRDFRPDVDPTVLAFMVLATVNWTSRWFDPAGPMSFEAVAEQYWLLIRDATLVRDEKPSR